MKKIILTMVILSAVFPFGSIEIMAQDNCVQHYRMSGACADANGRRYPPATKNFHPVTLCFRMPKVRMCRSNTPRPTRNVYAMGTHSVTRTRKPNPTVVSTTRTERALRAAAI